MINEIEKKFTELMTNDFNEDTSVKVDNSTYLYNGRLVPRVSTILSTMQHDEHLMEWANVMGLYKRKKISDIKYEACSIGTATHNMIEDYLENQPSSSSVFRGFEEANLTQKSQILNGYNGFLEWFELIKRENNVRVLSIEIKKSCEWFGGTYDMLIEINGKNYIVDFKTSNHVGYKYFLQLAAYWYLNKDIKIDGMIILQVSKKRVEFEEYVIDLGNEQHNKFMNSCLNCFCSLVNGYYWSETVKQQFDGYMKGR